MNPPHYKKKKKPVTGVSISAAQKTRKDQATAKTKTTRRDVRKDGRTQRRTGPPKGISKKAPPKEISKKAKIEYGNKLADDAFVSERGYIGFRENGLYNDYNSKGFMIDNYKNTGYYGEQRYEMHMEVLLILLSVSFIIALCCCIMAIMGALGIYIWNVRKDKRTEEVVDHIC
eukprot:139220_1